jgi:agmatine deiminase
MHMPAEWEPHERTWMAWPSAGYTLGETEGDAAEARGTWAAVARAVARFEPVTMVVDPSSEAVAREWLHGGGATAHPIDVVTAPLDDAWMRDIGPSFVREGAGLAAVDWVFNGWGGQEWASWGNDARVGTFVAETAGVPTIASPLVNEGGGIHVDGAGTVLVTDTVQLDPGRNPGWTRGDVEAELVRTLGVDTVVWLPRGLTRDYDEFGTRGHVDIVAAFTRPGTVLLHDQRDPAHPDHEVTAELRELLLQEGFDVIGIPAPTVLEDDDGWVDYSYINHYVVNGGVVLCAFDDPHDRVAAAILEEAYPGREVILVDARPLFARGGGIHCITQQQPRA